MAETTFDSDALTAERPRRLQFRRIIDMLLHPRATLADMREIEQPLWYTPILIILMLLVARVLVSAPIKAAQAESGVIMGDTFQYYTPEQQAQLQQAMQAMQGPVFQYVFPIGFALISALFIWSVTAGLLYLLSTLQGGRGSLTRALNLVAWASVPTIVHVALQTVYIQSTGTLIAASGLSGFVTAPPEGSIFAHALLARIDLYLIWHIILLIIGLKMFTGVTGRKVLISVLVSIVIVMGLRILPELLSASLSGLTVVRPFLF